MTDPEINTEPELDPENYFEEGYVAGQEAGDEAIREQLADELLESGFDPDDVEGALFSGETDVFKPRRRGRRGKRPCSAKQWAKMPQICGEKAGRRPAGVATVLRKRTLASRGPTRAVHKGRGSVLVYDPAPRFQGVRRRAKGMLGKLRKFALPASAGVTFVAAYKKRADELKAANALVEPGKPVDGIMSAIMYDLKNFDAEQAVQRIQNKATDIIVPLGIGYGIKKTQVLGKYSGLMADIVTGMGIGTAAKVILDPPVNSAPPAQNRNTNIDVPPRPTPATETYIPMGW